MDVLDQDTARRLQELENVSRGVKNNPLEILNYDEDEVLDDSKAIEAATDKILDDELEEEIIDLEDDEEELPEDELEDEDDE
jgi:hypothetical protein